MMNRLGGPLSKRRTRFQEVVQHDSPLDPEDCGGPLVNLDGEVIGINVARAGRIMSYAIPAESVRDILKL
jgi:serine protease Do